MSAPIFFQPFEETAVRSSAAAQNILVEQSAETHDHVAPGSLHHT
jgi:hypothetical protein